MADVITPQFGGGGNGNGGGGNTPTYAELLAGLENANKVILHQQQIIIDGKNKLAQVQSANEMLKLTIIDLIKTLQVNHSNITSSVRNLEEILKALPKI